MEFEACDPVFLLVALSGQRWSSPVSLTSEHLASLQHTVEYNWSGSRFQSRDGLYHGCMLGGGREREGGDEGGRSSSLPLVCLGRGGGEGCRIVVWLELGWSGVGCRGWPTLLTNVLSSSRWNRKG